jgi:N-acetylglucosamine-6-phosphate deacetylase
MSSAPSSSSPAQPDLFDFQINGFAGVDFQSDAMTRADLRRAVDALRNDGVGGVFLTLITDTEEALTERFRRIEAMRQADAQIAQVVRGYHLEGPWLCPEPGYCGAHPAECMGPPSLAAFTRMQDAAGGNIRLLTLAPEWSGSGEFIAEAVRRGVHVAIGHSNASEHDIDVAIAAGARFCTHLGNGVPGLLPRHDNIVQRLLARDELTACLIPDGIHLPPFVLQNFFRAKPADRVLFTTDAMAAAGASPGRYRLARLEVSVGSDGVVRGPNSGFAGSSLTPRQGVARATQMLQLDAAVAHRLWSVAPRAAFGLG